MEDNYKKAYKEVYEILGYLPKEDKEKVPEEMFNMLKTNMDKEYEYKLDRTKPFNEQIMLKETREILAVFYRDYWATKKQKEKIQKKILQDIKKAEELKKEKHNPNNIFKNEQENNNNEINEECSKNLIKRDNKKWYTKLSDFIKNILKK